MLLLTPLFTSSDIRQMLTASFVHD